MTLSEDEKEEKANKLKEDAHKLLEYAQKAGKQIKEELDELFSEATDRTEQIVSTSKGMASLQLTHVNKIRKFSSGDNFSRFCERFIEHVYKLNKIIS